MNCYGCMDLALHIHVCVRVCMVCVVWAGCIGASLDDLTNKQRIFKIAWWADGRMTSAYIYQLELTIASFKPVVARHKICGFFNGDTARNTTRPTPNLAEK